MRLGDFITDHMESIMAEWEAFAGTIVPPALTMDRKALRNHAKLMLEAIALDLRNPQSAEEQRTKSFGLGRKIADESSAETHAAQRLFAGFTIEQMISEYRALRASVLKLWTNGAAFEAASERDDMMRFNEAVDQAIAESVGRYASMVSKSQHLFLAILGHDLRNPLATTMMAAQFIMQGGDPEKVQTAALRIHHAGKRMNQLVNDLIDYTRTNLGSNLPIIPKPANMERLCTEAIAEQELAHPECAFRLLASGNSDGIWDDNRVAQVFSNLLGNAVQYGAPGEPIVVRVQPIETDILFSVANRGSTIPDTQLGRIFEPLVRLASEGEAQMAGNSLGIGLYIAKEIVRAHGGDISVLSTHEEGTIFSVRLPRCASPALV
jgi:signal transduction histidine kinase